MRKLRHPGASHARSFRLPGDEASADDPQYRELDPDALPDIVAQTHRLGTALLGVAGGEPPVSPEILVDDLRSRFLARLGAMPEISSYSGEGCVLWKDREDMQRILALVTTEPQ